MANLNNPGMGHHCAERQWDRAIEVLQACEDLSERNTDLKVRTLIPYMIWSISGH
jgi:DNA polymerase III delta prime subunit